MIDVAVMLQAICLISLARGYLQLIASALL